MTTKISTLFRAAQRHPRTDAIWQYVDGLGPDGVGGVVIIDKETAQLRALRDVDGEVTDAVMLGAMRDAMLAPLPPGKPERPALVEVDDAMLAWQLGKSLRLIGVRVEKVDRVEVAEEAWDVIYGSESLVDLFPPGIEVTVSDELPAWMHRKLAAVAPTLGEADDATVPPWIIIWADANQVDACVAALDGLEVLSMLDPDGAPEDDEVADDEGGADGGADLGADGDGDDGTDDGADDDESDEDDESDDDDYDDEPSLIVRGPAGFSVLVERAEPDLLRLLRDSAGRSDGEVHLVVAQRHATEPPPALTRLAGGVRLQLDVV